MSNRGQLSIEMVILILAVLVSGSYVALEMSKGSFETTAVNDAQDTTYCGFASGFNVDVINNAVVKLTTGIININPNDAVTNNEFNATYTNTTDNSVITYSLDNVHPNLIMTYANGTEVYVPLNETWKNFTASNIVLRMKSDYVCTINGENVSLESNCFEITAPDGSDEFNFQMSSGTGAGQYYLRLVDQEVTLIFSME
ncbi:class III signal peptide-containing protein [Methanococcus sp. CF]